MKKEQSKDAVEVQVEKFVRFGKELKISPKANAQINKPGATLHFHNQTVQVPIQIGKYTTGYVIMSREAWENLNAGDSVKILTTEEFKQKTK